mmetsp:Transcript_94682/g.265115  ORF Transcript_94682/g.265115 Transcript_94682/m.265115 type:complete len:309 (-) Transcript_94682:21-947(-)|eukprot:CAMPEP_0176192498 /NCGR_PEP_ID=MMETSP0121_2-20121125/5002_1 /TAXON_ID=160619 /ORGANISM="Kryptoperidinium foliaceum, Strain CCMP 1326" /LENGTH=308 /DNA_ID=CAMNT_0017531187 /DNA_START=159 /DNA_END=1082 /DNA_ORIENTATION=+
MSLLWSDYATDDNSDTASCDNVPCGDAQDNPTEAPWSFLFEFAEPETCHAGSCGGAGDISDDLSDSEDELETREYPESIEGGGAVSGSAQLTETASSSSRAGWRLSHRSVPKSTDLSARYGGGSASSTASGSGVTSTPPPAGGVTTLMLRHLPNMYTRSMLVEELDSVGLAGTYDFLYLPIDKSTQWNVGYAFVNFVNPAAASKCVGLLTDHVFKRYDHNSGKVTQVAVAHIQGLERNMEFFSKTAVQLGSRFNRPLVCAAKAVGSSSASSKKGPPARRRRRPKRPGASGEAPSDGAGDAAPTAPGER